MGAFSSSCALPSSNATGLSGKAWCTVNFEAHYPTSSLPLIIHSGSLTPQRDSEVAVDRSTKVDFFELDLQVRLGRKSTSTYRLPTTCLSLDHRGNSRSGRFDFNPYVCTYLLPENWLNLLQTKSVGDKKVQCTWNRICFRNIFRLFPIIGP